MPDPSPSGAATAPTRYSRRASSGDGRSAATKYLSLLRTLTFSEFKLRYAHSSLGYLWTVSKPLLLFGVMFVVFSQMLRFGEGIEYYPLVLLQAIMLWGFFAEATSGAISILVSRADLLRKASFPRSILPVSVVATSFLVFACNLIALAVFVVIAGAPPRIEWALIPVLLAELTAFTIALSLLLSGMFVYLRDIGQLWTVSLQLLFYATPIIYPLELLQENGVSESWIKFLMCSPIAQIIQDARWALVGGTAAPTWELLGWLIVIPFGLVAGAMVAGLATYRRYAARIAEHV